MQNKDFQEELEKRVERIYRKSFIFEYYNLNLDKENKVVYFVDKDKKPIYDNRFQVFVLIPKQSKTYFMPQSEWQKIDESNGDVYIPVSLLSNIYNGFATSSYQTSKSLYYESPFFLVMRSPFKADPNFLRFTDFLKPNSEETLVAMLEFDEIGNKMKLLFSPKITFTFHDMISLNHTLEFVFVDSQRKKISCNDNSKLYLELKM